MKGLESFRLLLFIFCCACLSFLKSKNCFKGASGIGIFASEMFDPWLHLVSKLIVRELLLRSWKAPLEQRSVLELCRIFVGDAVAKKHSGVKVEIWSCSRAEMILLLGFCVSKLVLCHASSFLYFSFSCMSHLSCYVQQMCMNIWNVHKHVQRPN